MQQQPRTQARQAIMHPSSMPYNIASGQCDRQEERLRISSAAYAGQPATAKAVQQAQPVSSGISQGPA